MNCKIFYNITFWTLKFLYHFKSKNLNYQLLLCVHSPVQSHYCITGAHILQKWPIFCKYIFNSIHAHTVFSGCRLVVIHTILIIFCTIKLIMMQLFQHKIVLYFKATVYFKQPETRHCKISIIYHVIWELFEEKKACFSYTTLE
jgi:hypothetical protein